MSIQSRLLNLKRVRQLTQLLWGVEIRRKSFLAIIFGSVLVDVMIFATRAMIGETLLSLIPSTPLESLSSLRVMIILLVPIQGCVIGNNTLFNPREAEQAETFLVTPISKFELCCVFISYRFPQVVFWEMQQVLVGTYLLSTDFSSYLETLILGFDILPVLILLSFIFMILTLWLTARIGIRSLSISTSGLICLLTLFLWGDPALRIYEIDPSLFLRTLFSPLNVGYITITSLIMLCVALVGIRQLPRAKLIASLGYSPIWRKIRQKIV